METGFFVNVDPIYEVTIHSSSKNQPGKEYGVIHGPYRLSAKSELAAIDTVLKKLLFMVPGSSKVCPSIQKFLAGRGESPFTKIEVKKIRDKIPQIPVTYSVDLPDLHGISFIKGEKQ